MEFIDIMVLACGILCLISGAIACLYNYLTGLIIIVGGVYLLFLVMYEIDKCCDYPFITTDILKIMLNNKADRQLINALLKNRGDK